MILSLSLKKIFRWFICEIHYELRIVLDLTVANKCTAVLHQLLAFAMPVLCVHLSFSASTLYVFVTGRASGLQNVSNQQKTCDGPA